jgi:oligopeptide transport system permease protein
MLEYTAKRFGQSLITILLVVSIVFLLLRLMPTDYYFTEDQLMKFTEQQKHDQLLAAGLLDPPLTQLLDYLGNIAHLDFGTSRRIQNSVPVFKIIAEKFTVSMRLGITAIGIALVVGVLIGITQARFKDKLPDFLGTCYSIFVNAVPPLVSYSLVLVFGSRVLGLPSLYSTRNTGPSIILPIVCLAMVNIAWWAMWTRRYMVDEINKDYIKLARIKGMSSQSIMTKHVLRNAFVPLAQYLPLSLLSTIGGSLLVERFFSVPGMGPLLTDAIRRYDTNIVQALVILYSVISITGVFLGDVLMMVVDPRITLAKKKGAR